MNRTRWILAVSLSLLGTIGACTAWFFHEASARGVGIGTGIFSTGRCLEGTNPDRLYERVAPSLCINKSNVALAPNASLNPMVNLACTNISSQWQQSVPGSAQRVLIEAQLALESSGAASAAGATDIAVVLYSDASCTTRYPSTGFMQSNDKAQATTIAGEDIFDRRFHVVIFTSGNTSVYAKQFVTIPANTLAAAFITVMGYYD